VRGMAVGIVALVLAACGGEGARETAAGGYACDDARFAADRQAMTSGRASGDRLEDVCGTVARVLASHVTRSGRHGYFVMRLPAGDSVEIIANLDAMAGAPSNRPPAWPWVRAGEYVYVEGRYFADPNGRDGIDWTEDDIGRSWPHTGYVAVCDASRAACRKYW